VAKRRGSNKMAAQTYGTTGGYDSELAAGGSGDAATAEAAAAADVAARDALNAETEQERTLRLETPFVTDTEPIISSSSDAAAVRVLPDNVPDSMDRRTADEIADEDEASPDVVQARAQVEHTRAELSDTIDAIKEKLSPQNLMAEAKEAAVEKAHDAVSGAVDSAKEMASGVVNTAQEAIGSAVEAAKSVASGVADSASRVIGGAAHAMDSVTPTLRSAGETAKGAGATLVDTIRLNPIPAAITGIGLGWLIMSIRRQNETRDYQGSTRGDNYQTNAGRYDSTTVPYNADRFASAADEFGGQTGTSNNYATANTVSSTTSEPSTLDTVKDTLGDAKDKVAQAASSVGQSVSGAAQTVAHSASDLAHNVSDKASALGSQAKDYGQRAVSATGDYYQTSPLAVGAIALLFGAAVGLLVPSTEPENRWMGETRDRLKDQAAQQLHEVADKVQNVAGAAMDKAKTTVTETVQQEAKNQGLTTASA